MLHFIQIHAVGCILALVLLAILALYVKAINNWFSNWALAMGRTRFASADCSEQKSKAAVRAAQVVGNVGLLYATPAILGLISVVVIWLDGFAMALFELSAGI